MGSKAGRFAAILAILGGLFALSYFLESYNDRSREDRRKVAMAEINEKLKADGYSPIPDRHEATVAEQATDGHAKAIQSGHSAKWFFGNHPNFSEFIFVVLFFVAMVSEGMSALNGGSGSPFTTIGGETVTIFHANNTGQLQGFSTLRTPSSTVSNPNYRPSMPSQKPVRDMTIAAIYTLGFIAVYYLFLRPFIPEDYYIAGWILDRVAWLVVFVVGLGTHLF